MRKIPVRQRIRKRKQKEPAVLPVPSEDRIATLCRILTENILHEQRDKAYAHVKNVLALLGAGSVIGLSLIAPTAVIVAKPFLDEHRRKEQEKWKQFNHFYLKRTLARLQRQKLVEVKERDGEEVVVLTQGGKRRILRYALNQLNIQKPRSWDGRWRLVLYDVDSRKKRLRDVFRSTLKGLGFYKLQESVWLHPYPCEEQIMFLREYYGVGNEVLYVIATKLEDDTPYRTFYGLD